MTSHLEDGHVQRSRAGAAGRCDPLPDRVGRDLCREGRQQDHGEVVAQHALAQIGDVAAQRGERARDVGDDADAITGDDGDDVVLMHRVSFYSGRRAR